LKTRGPVFSKEWQNLEKQTANFIYGHRGISKLVSEVPEAVGNRLSGFLHRRHLETTSIWGNLPKKHTLMKPKIAGKWTLIRPKYGTIGLEPYPSRRMFLYSFVPKRA